MSSKQSTELFCDVSRTMSGIVCRRNSKTKSNLSSIIAAQWPRTERSVARMGSFESIVSYTTPGSLDSQSRRNTRTPAFYHYADHESSHRRVQYNQYNSNHTPTRPHATPTMTCDSFHSAHIRIPNLDNTQYVTFYTHIPTPSSPDTKALHFILFICLSLTYTTHVHPHPIGFPCYLSRTL